MFTTKQDENMMAAAGDFGIEDEDMAEMDFELPEELLDETKRDHKKYGRPQDPSVYSMAGRSLMEETIDEEEDDSESQGKQDDVTSTLTGTTEEMQRLEEENRKLREKMAKYKIGSEEEGIEERKAGKGPSAGTAESGVGEEGA